MCDVDPNGEFQGGSHQILIGRETVGMRREQMIVTGLIGYATFITAVCPCRKLLSCHLDNFFVSTLLAQAIVLYYNVP